MQIDWKVFQKIVQDNDRFVLTSHMRPDCDALGSELGMLHLLESLGKEVHIVNGDSVPPHIQFIDPQRRIGELGRDVLAEAISEFDALIVLDTSAWSQLGPMAEVVRSFNGAKIVVDHHVSSDDLGAFEFKDESAAATGVLVLEAANEFGIELCENMANALFAAIATDTGWFRFSSVDARTLNAAASLVAAGANPVNTFSVLYEKNSLERLHLRARILAAARRDASGKVIHSSASLADFAETGAEMTDTEDVVNMLLTVAGTECAALFTEVEAEKVKISLRSRGDVDVRQVAEKFGGGGHVAAAGVTFSGTMELAISSILDALFKAV